MQCYLKQSTFSISVWIFFKLLGVVYLSAFLSYWVQIPGLIGENGILPANIFLEASKYNLEEKAYYYLPTLAWISSSDIFINLLALAGLLFSLLLIFGYLTLPAAIILYILHLSLVVIGQSFMSFQWDVLLLETGFLAIFISPRNFFYRLGTRSEPSKLLLILFWFLLFRLIFSSGIGKILSSDPVWANLTALNYHYFTQPLPTPLAWYVNLLPHIFHKVSVVIMLLIEIFIPFLFFAPRFFRHNAGILLIILQLFIMFTGNYTYFNILTIAICILLFDDKFLFRFIPGRLKGKFSINESKSDAVPSNFKKIGLYTIFTTIIFIGSLQLFITVFGFWSLPVSMQKVVKTVSPFRTFGRYGLFTVMTTTRPEIIIEGSNDGVNWSEYKFKYKPSDLNGNLPLIAPYQPRLDWQMWFAALGNYQGNSWFLKLIDKIGAGSQEVLELLAYNPFPDKPPLYLRAILYEYNFTDYKERKENNNIWNRKLIGYYLPEIRVN